MPPIKQAPRMKLSAAVNSTDVKTILKPLPSPVWKGPEVDGITQSQLQKFLNDRERFRLYMMEGLVGIKRFNHRTGYGDMWHVCEEAHAGKKDWLKALAVHTQGVIKEHPLQQSEVIEWAEICEMQFPIYVQYWAKHKDVVSREPLLQEYEFKVPYVLPSGRIVSLRGKWDSVDLIDGGIYLQENKTKGDFDVLQLQKQLQFDLQTMFYLVALKTQREKHPSTATENFQGAPIKGVRYNVIRRPLSGGKGAIRPHKAKSTKKKHTPAESRKDFLKRLGETIKTASGPEWGVPVNENHFFRRWRSEVSESEIRRFKHQHLRNALQQLCEWYDWIKGCMADGGDPFLRSIHWRHPYGVFNPINEGMATDTDEYLNTGNMIGLRRTDNLFPELKGG